MKAREDKIFFAKEDKPSFISFREVKVPTYWSLHWPGDNSQYNKKEKKCVTIAKKKQLWLWHYFKIILQM